MTWFACCEWRSRFSSTTTRATRKVLLCQWRRDCAHTAAQTFWEKDADRREGLSNSSFRPCSAAMTVKDPLNNKLKHVERCQTLLVGENNKKKKKTMLKRGNIQQLERGIQQTSKWTVETFFFFYSRCSPRSQNKLFFIHRLHSIFPHQNYLSASHTIQVACLYILANLFSCWRNIC